MPGTGHRTSPSDCGWVNAAPPPRDGSLAQPERRRPFLLAPPWQPARSCRGPRASEVRLVTHSRSQAQLFADGRHYVLWRHSCLRPDQQPVNLFLVEPGIRDRTLHGRGHHSQDVLPLVSSFGSAPRPGQGQPWRTVRRPAYVNSWAYSARHSGLANEARFFTGAPDAIAFAALSTFLPLRVYGTALTANTWRGRCRGEA
jgi:hypothetical protein